METPGATCALSRWGRVEGSVVFDLIWCFVPMVPEWTTSTGNVARTRPRGAIDLEAEAKVTKDWEGGKSGKVVADGSGTSIPPQLWV